MPELNFNKFFSPGSLQTELIGSPIASGETISPNRFIHEVTGTEVISTINVPYPDFVGPIVLLAQDTWSWDINGNISVASGGNVTVGLAYPFFYDLARSKWYPILASSEPVGELVIGDLNVDLTYADDPVPQGDGPVASFDWNKAGESSLVSFTDTSTPGPGGIDTYDWDFGDGSPHSSAQNPTHNYDLSGDPEETHTFVVTLTVTGPLGSSQAQDTLIIAATPAGTDSSVIIGEYQVTVTAPNIVDPGGLLVYEWSYWDEHSGSEEAPAQTGTSASFVITIPGPDTPTCSPHIKVTIGSFGADGSRSSGTGTAALLPFNSTCP